MARRNSKPHSKKRIKRGHATARNNPTKARPRLNDPRFEAAMLEMNRGRSMTAAARASHISRRRFLKFAIQQRLVKRKGRRWRARDNRLRIMSVITTRGILNLTLRGYEQARLVGEHHEAVGEFVRTNKIELLDSFKGRAVQAANGRRYSLETRPNELHRLAAMDSPPFHEIYKITSET